MDALRSRLTLRGRISQEEDRRPRLRLPLVPALVGTLALMNVASAVLAMIN
ncbi:hypothetical protein SAMN02927923_04228 [Microvirga guangxiensis]|uniref:Uncharacterized protein n=1 Tax=Microvirga guangxiensis TaxID=549386 RepID=A0A1G5LEK8_9HYPH|nr:hypothetical protein SAMN02927923_04228 [Microvirga guangxiensis]